MAELRGIGYLRTKLINKRSRVLTRYNYYEMKNVIRDFGISTPPHLQWFQESLGWCGKAVDSLADRLRFKEFQNDNFNITEIYKMNNPDVLYDSAILSALIGSCSFIYISKDESGYPTMQVVDGSNATGIIDPVTGMLTEGYAVLERDKNEEPTIEAYFIPGRTQFIEKTSKGINEYTVDYNCNFPLLVPIIYRPDAKRLFGHSRISRACMDIQNGAMRTIKRSEIAAEFFSYPQKYVTGLAEDAEPMDKWKATMSSLLTFTKDEDGDHPIMGQFAQQSMEPHISQLKMFAALFAGETGLTLDDLGFASGNPSSSDAIKAAHENLRLTARKAQGNLGTGFLNAGIVAASVRDNFAYNRVKFYETVPSWYPVFEADGASMSGTGDAIIKINQAVPDYFDKDKIEGIIGV